MIAILIFAGRSTRFWPLSEKNFFPVWGTTLLERQVSKLQNAGFKDIVLVGGTHNVKMAKRLLPGIPVVTQSDKVPGMRGALLAALPRAKKEGVLIVSANDVIDESAFRELLAKGKSLKAGGLILARKVSAYFPGGYLKTAGKRIVSIVEKPKPGKEPSSLVNIVAHVHADASVLLKALQSVKGSKDDAYERTLDGLFKKFVYDAVPYTGLWQPVKYSWHLLDLIQDIDPGTAKPVIPKSCSVHPTAVIEGGVRLGENVKVMAHATIMGPCYVGDDSVVANNALVRCSSVGKRCVIGYNTEVARSVLGDDVWTHSSYLGDSVLGSDISLGAGTTTGNLRFDEATIVSAVQGQLVDTGRTKLGVIIGDHSRTGIHTCFAPGVKIGAGTWIFGHDLVASDVPDGSFVKSGVVRPNNKAGAPPPDRTSFRSALKGKGG